MTQVIASTLLIREVQASTQIAPPAGISSKSHRRMSRAQLKRPSPTPPTKPQIESWSSLRRFGDGGERRSSISLSGHSDNKTSLDTLHKMCPVIGEVCSAFACITHSIRRTTILLCRVSLRQVLDVNTRTTIDENPALNALADFVIVNVSLLERTNSTHERSSLNLYHVPAQDLAARLIASIAFRREVATVLNELLGPRGQDLFVWKCQQLLHDDELVMRAPAACVDVGSGQWFSDEESHDSLVDGVAAKQVSFAEMMVRARTRNCILIGYVKHAHDGNAADEMGEVVTILNPTALNSGVSKDCPLYWHSQDFLVVIGDGDLGLLDADTNDLAIR